MVFDESERNTFLQKFVGSRSMKTKKAKKFAKASAKQKKTKSLRKKILDEPIQDFEETKYDEQDLLNNISVKVTTKRQK